LAEGGFDAEGAGVGWVGVGADGVRFETEAPLVRLRQPEGEVGVGEREGSFDLVELEVQARAGGLDVGEAGRGADELLGCGRCVCLGTGGLKDKALQIPVAIGGADEVNAGSVSEMRENSTRRPQSELMRRLARTSPARRMGSEPKAGSSSTTKFSSVRPGRAAD